MLADYLNAELNTLQGELSDLLEARNRGDCKSQADARFKMDLDDGVMINSAALYGPLFEEEPEKPALEQA